MNNHYHLIIETPEGNLRERNGVVRTGDRIFDRTDISIFKGKSFRLKGNVKVKHVDLKMKKK